MSRFVKKSFDYLNDFRGKPTCVSKEMELVKIGLGRMSPKNPFIPVMDKFINSLKQLEPMPELTLSQNLCDIAAKELENYLNEENYIKYKTGRDLKGIIESKSLNNYCLIADEWANEAENITPKLLLNNEDKRNSAQKFLLNPETQAVGIAVTEDEENKYVVVIFSTEEQQEKSNVLRSKRKKAQDDDKDQDYPLPDVDLTELKMAFDLFDPGKTGSIKIDEVIHAMDSMHFNETNPTLYKIVADLKEEDNDMVTWNKFANVIDGSINDRETDQGLENMYKLIIDDPKEEVINLEVYRKIVKELGLHFTDDEIKHIFENTTEDGETISQNDFNKYMKK